MLIRPWKIVCQLKFWFNNFIIFGNWISSFHVHYLWAELMWDFKLYDWENAFLHDSHLWSFWPLWTEWMCFFKSPARENKLPHESHLWSFWPLWTALLCLFKYPARENDISHESQLWNFLFSWAIFTCELNWLWSLKFFGKYYIDILSSNYEQYWNAVLSHYCSWILCHKFHISGGFAAVVLIHINQPWLLTIH